MHNEIASDERASMCRVRRAIIGIVECFCKLDVIFLLEQRKIVGKLLAGLPLSCPLEGYSRVVCGMF